MQLLYDCFVITGAACCRIWQQQWQSHTTYSRYTFSAKEKPACRNASSGRDDETQYSYFGARYYDSDLSVWLSVDPLSDKYPSLSPYAYCANNPVMLVDPDGMRIDRVNSVGLGAIRRALKSNSIGRQTWREMKKSKSMITLILSNSVTVVNNGDNWMSPVQGAQLNTGRIITKGVKDNKYGSRSPINKDDMYYSSQTIYVSLGTLEMKQNIEKTYNDSWNNLTTEQKNEGIQEQLKTGNYTVYNVDNASNVDPSRFDIISVAVNPYSVIGIPTDETSTEFINRVSVHEGKGHGIYGLFNDFLASAMRKNPKDQEQFSYEQEQTAVNQNNAKRR